MSEAVKVLIVAGDPLARTALATVIGDIAECQVIGLANPSTIEGIVNDGEEEADFDLLVWDWGWEPGMMSPVDLLALEVPVLVLLADGEQVEEAWAAGARAMLKRDASGEALCAAATAALRGLVVIDPELATSFLPAPLASEAPTVEELTPRELEVLHLLAEGLTNKGIGERLGISKHTVKFHVNAILGKLNAQSRTEAVVRATRAGLLAL
jgi:DNA-binding NarL/FixJ family response regulator